MNHEAGLVFRMREAWGDRSRNLSEADKKAAMFYFSGYRQSLLRDLKNKRDELVADIKTATADRTRLSVPSLIANRLVMEIPRVIDHDALNQMAANKVNNFLVLADASMGSTLVLHSVTEGEEYIAGIAENKVSETIGYVAESFDPSIDAVRGAGIYIKMMEEAKLGSSALIKDNSGAKTVEDKLKSLRKGFSVAGYRGLWVPEFTLAGAQLAVDAYKYLYAVVNK
ncbi:MAG TPA: hypothetical protein VG917_04495 [Patescibacteria group bacterium]|nr:hypothetical protein [Patescibacteria group bacterium]